MRRRIVSRTKQISRYVVFGSSTIQYSYSYVFVIIHVFIIIQGPILFFLTHDNLQKQSKAKLSVMTHDQQD